MPKPCVFISHISEDEELAVALKELINTSFLGIVDVFVSSDEGSISMGDDWLERITRALRECAVEIILCSPMALHRPWVNFEAGAGWVRSIPVIPLCYSGTDPSNLPLPLKLRQGALASDALGLRSVFSSIAKSLCCTAPSTDFADFINLVRSIESRHAAQKVGTTQALTATAKHSDVNNSPTPEPALSQLAAEIRLLGYDLQFAEQDAGRHSDLAWWNYVLVGIKSDRIPDSGNFDINLGQDILDELLPVYWRHYPQSEIWAVALFCDVHGRGVLSFRSAPKVNIGGSTSVEGNGSSSFYFGQAKNRWVKS